MAAFYLNVFAVFKKLLYVNVAHNYVDIGFMTELSRI